jgi:excisionase family DNA binding protein
MLPHEIILQKLTALEELFSTQKAILNIDELAQLTKLSKSYLYKLTASKKIPHYTTSGGKILSFKREEIDIWRTSHRVSTIDEIEAQAISYVNKNKPKTK